MLECIPPTIYLPALVCKAPVSYIMIEAETSLDSVNLESPITELFSKVTLDTQFEVAPFAV
jgi:hypothetical protein